MSEYLIDETTTHITEKSGGAEYKFRLLTPYDRLGIIVRLKKSQRDEILADAVESGLDKEDKFTELNGFKNRWDDASEFVKYVNSEQANTELSELAIEGVEPDKVKAVIAAMRPADWLVFKAALCNLRVFAQENPANPQRPPVTNPNPAAPGLAYGT